MIHGKSVKLFLVDGTPNGILTAEIINWTGHVLSAPRTKLAELIKREECSRTGIYFLVGYDPEYPMYPKVYIGESDDVANRLKQHNRTEDSGGKDFWEKVCLVTGKDQNITKAHIKYLESRLMSIAQSNGQCQLENGTAHTYARLPESDIADMEYFIEQIQVVLPVLGYEFLKDIKRPQHQMQKQIKYEKQDIEKTNFYLFTQDKSIKAYAQVIDGEFFVLEGSEVRRHVSQPNHNYMKNLRPRLFEDGVFDSEKFIFTKDFLFNSPSAAAAVIMGRATNGRTRWRQSDTDITYEQWQQNQVDGA